MIKRNIQRLIEDHLSDRKAIILFEPRQTGKRFFKTSNGWPTAIFGEHMINKKSIILKNAMAY